MSKRGNLAQLKIDSPAPEALDDRREIQTTKGDVVDAASRCHARSFPVLHQVYDGVRARVQPVAVGLERRTPALAQPDDVAVELPELRDVRGWRPNVHMMNRLDGHRAPV